MANKPDPLANTRLLAEKGEAFAQFHLGRYLVNEDRQEAIKWLGLAARQGHAEAKAMLAELAKIKPAAPKPAPVKVSAPADEMPEPELISDPLDFGPPHESTESLLAAAERGEAAAMVALGDRYKTGDGVPENPAE